MRTRIKQFLLFPAPVKIIFYPVICSWLCLFMVYQAFGGYRVYGGREAPEDAHPWMVEVRKNGGPHCGGILIHPGWVLTAAHCVRNAGQIPVEYLSVRTGIHNVKNPEPDSTVFEVRQTYWHPDYRSEEYPFDIGLIELEGMSAKETMPLYRGSDSLAGETATVYGWGKTESGYYSDVLMMLDMDVWDNASCQQAYVDYGYPSSTITDEIVCAGGVAGKDACAGDSGGPLIFTDPADGVQKVMGVVSFGPGSYCGLDGIPGGYSRVSMLTDFVDTYVPDIMEYDMTQDGRVNLEDSLAMLQYISGVRTGQTCSLEEIIISLHLLTR